MIFTEGDLDHVFDQELWDALLDLRDCRLLLREWLSIGKVAQATDGMDLVGRTLEQIDPVNGAKEAR